MRISDWSSDVCSSDLARRWPLHQFLPCDSTTARVPSERLQTGISPVCCAGAARAAGAAAIAARAHAMAQARLELRISMCTDLPDHQLSVGPIGSAGTVNTEKAERTRHAAGRVRPAPGKAPRRGRGGQYGE